MRRSISNGLADSIALAALFLPDGRIDEGTFDLVEAFRFAALIDDFRKCRNHLQIVAPIIPYEMIEGFPDTHAISVGTRCRPCAENIGNAENTRTQTDLITCQPMRVAGAVQPLMHLSEDVDNRQIEVNPFEDIDSVKDVASHDLSFLVIMSIWLAQNVVGDEALAALREGCGECEAGEIAA